MELKVQIKQAGKRENRITTAKLLLKRVPQTLEELLKFTVKATHSAHVKKTKLIEAFEAGDVSEVIIYTQEQLEDQASTGKIAFGFLKSEKTVSEKQAIETALQAFEDGLVAVFIDGIRYEELQERLHLTGNEIITFVKLTMLSGRMW